MNARVFFLLMGGWVGAFLSLGAAGAEAGRDGNRLTYLMEGDPFYVGTAFPKLTTPQWIGDSNVEAAVTFGVDDMRASQPYETYLRPLLERLKKIDGHAPVSIFSVAPTPDDPRLQEWLKEGVSFEVHTLTHPCPILAKSNFTAAANVFYGCIDLLNTIPGNKPVAFRTPCCDSINSASPRLFSELMCKTGPTGGFVQMDSSVVMLITTNDTALTADDLVDAKGSNRFLKYVPFPSFKTTIENYPYPYAINGVLWEMPFVAPSDWESFHIQGSLNPQMLKDWEKALEIIVRKRGIFNFVFHPHGWSGTNQMVGFVDFAQEKFGNRVKFLNYPETLERINKNMLAGQPLKTATGGDNGVRLIDLDGDGFLDVVIGNAQMRRTRLWKEAARKWIDGDLPAQLVRADGRDNGVRFGILADGKVSLIVANETERGAWTFDGSDWKEDRDLVAGLEGIAFAEQGRDRGARLRDVDGDGVCELFVSNETRNLLFQWDGALRKWKAMDFALPNGVTIVNAAGQDNGVRFADVNEDGHDDLIFSNQSGYGFWIYMPQLYLGFARGWSREVSRGARGDVEAIPAFVRAGANRDNGAWFHSKTLWVQNEDTAELPDLVERRTFADLMVGSKPEAKSPEEALKSFVLDPNFQIEVVASEPLVQDPVNFEWDARGRLWVVEMRDYPLGIDGKGKPGGVVKFLTDTDGDGKYDKATDFLTGVNFPNGVMPWRNGVLVSAAPEIFFAADESGDGVADQRKVLITGFAPGNQQHRVNGFAFGMDGWVYCANGESGGTLRAISGVLNPAGATEPIRFHGDLRFRPDNAQLEAIEGTTQFGRRRDDWDNWFGNNNPSWLWHYYLPSRYVERNPNLRIADLRVYTPENNNLFPAGKTQQRFNDIGKGNTASAANSATPYRDELFGRDFENSVFISDPSFNLIHREVLEPDGVSFKSHRVANETDREFLSSRDTWFRPTTIKIGPDGALYIADMYRFVIEHPEWIPADVQKNLNLRAGEGKGRIYRVYPKGATLRAIPNLEQMSVTQWVAALDSPNGWQRDTVEQLLIWRTNAAAPALLRELIKTSGRGVARAQALWTLQNLGALSVEDAVAALKDSDARVRIQALRASESLKAPQVAEAAAALATDADERVAFQLALSLGEWRDASAGRALAKVWRRFPKDARFRNAVLSSSPAHLVALLDDLAVNPPANEVESRFASEFFALAPAGSDATVQMALKAIESAKGAWRFGALGQLMDAFARGRGAPAEARAAIERMAPEARALAIDNAAREEDRVEAIRLLGEKDLAALQQLLLPNVPAGVQKAALNQMAKLRVNDVADVLVKVWQNAGPALRQETLNLFFSRPEWIKRLLTALETGEIPPNVIDAPHQQMLRTRSSNAIAARANKIFSATDSNRAAVIAKYESAKSLPGNPANGAAIFRQNCAACHRFRDEGFALGPDLGSVAEKPMDYLMTAILDPNQAVEARYLNYTATTKDGSEFSGVISSETANSVTLSGANDAKNTLLRADIKQLASGGKSLMPEGFENGVPPQGLADLLSYLKSNIHPKSFTGNTPKMIQPSTDGTIHLSASNAEIFGDTLAFESNFRNLGYWESESDRASWTARLARDGAYDVYIHYALPEETKTNRLHVQAGRQEIVAAIPATGAWEKYKIAQVGRFDLGGGDQTIVVSGVAPFRGPLLDLKELILVPRGQPAPPQP